MSVKILVFSIVTFTVSINLYAQSFAFGQAGRGLFFEDSHRGYGFLAPRGTGSELGIVTSRSLGCLYSTSDAYHAWEVEEKRDLDFIFSLLLGDRSLPHLSDEKHLKFLELREDSRYFYSTKHKYLKKIFSSKIDEWMKLPESLRMFSEKFFHIELKALPSENIKAVVLMDILKKRSGIQYRNLEISLRNSFFLISESYKEKSRALVKDLFRLEDSSYEAFINKEERFYKLGDSLARIQKKVQRAHKLMSKGKDQVAYQSFLSFHQTQLNLFKQKLLENGHALVENQAFAQGVRQEPSCALEAVKIQCESFKRLNQESSIAAPFYLEYFQAWREFSVSEDEALIVELNLKFFKEASVGQDQFNKLLNKWILWADNFYNDDLEYKGKKVQFRFSFVEAAAKAEDVINIRKCWNAARNSSDCSLPTQPNAKNFTVDLRKDALLEEVGHHMGLLDEYRMPYYLFNALGAKDSFMIADDSYKIYESHLLQILAPHQICK